MRILLTTPSYPPFNNGLANAVTQQANHLALAGHEVVVATSGAASGTRITDGIRVETFALSGADYWLNPIQGDVQAYINFLLCGKWDVLLLNAWQNWATDLAIRHIDQIPGRKYVYSHCISANTFYALQPLRSLLRFLCWRPYWWRLSTNMQRLQGVIFLAPKGADRRFDDLKLALKHNIPIRFVPNSLSPAGLTCLEQEPVSLSERNRLIAVGSFSWQKGFDFIIRAYAASEARKFLPLYLYGQEHTAYSKKLRSLSRSLGLSDNKVVLTAGISSELLMRSYTQARLCLCGSYTECQPLVLLDANASGTPFVARKTGCIDSMPGGVTVNSLREMTKQIDMLTMDDSTWLELANTGRHAAKSHYHPRVTSKLLLNALDAFTNEF